MLVSLLGAPFLLPVIVAVLGILAIYGRSGAINSALIGVGFGRLDIYGFQGVVLAHVFFNLPLAARLFLQGWQSIPAEHFRLAAQLGMTTRDINRHLETPMLRAVLPGALATIFLLCVTSFAVALTLGGGPRATTIELAIYQAFRFDFDLAKAALLSVTQFSICAAAAFLAWKFARPVRFGPGLNIGQARWDQRTALATVTDILVLVLLTGFLLTPLVMVLLHGLSGLGLLTTPVFLAALNSIIVAVSSSAITLGLALALALAVTGPRNENKPGAGIIEATGYLALAASPLVIGTGLFIVLFPIIDPARLALPLTALVNATLSLPFAIRILVPALREARHNYDLLSDSLGIGPWDRFRLVIWPDIKPAAAFATGLAAALSMGDLGVIALFADPDAATLPLMLYRLMASYQMEAANAAALLLVALSFGLLWTFDAWGRRGA